MEAKKTEAFCGEMRRIEQEFETDRVCKEIMENEFKNVILQLPNSLLKDAVLLLRVLKGKLAGKGTQASLSILADNMKNPCCVDFIGAQHLPCDSIFHFGDTCFSNSSHATIPVHYVLPKTQCDFERLKGAMDKFKEENLTIFFDTEYQHLEFLEFFKGHSLCSVKLKSKDPDPENQEEFLGRWLQKSKKRNNILFIGDPDAPVLKALAMAAGKYGFNQVFFLDPRGEDSEAKEITNGSSLVLKRYFLIEKAQKAEVFGIIIMSPEFTQGQVVLESIKDLLTINNKKHYVYPKDKLNEAKVNNFSEVDVYVIISCFLSSHIDFKEFMKPILTPGELRIALEIDSWTGHIDFNLNRLDQVLKRPRPMGNESANNEERKEETAVQLLDNKGELISANVFQSLDHFMQRSFRGLETAEGVEPSLAVKGKSGIPMHYKSEDS